MNHDNIIETCILAKDQNSKVYIKYLKSNEMELIGHVVNSDSELVHGYQGLVIIKCFHTGKIIEVNQTTIDSIVLTT